MYFRIWIWVIIDKLVVNIAAMECALCTPIMARVADSCWVLKDGTEANAVMESGNELHSVNSSCSKKTSETELRDSKVP